jgi:hypothetical protein
VQAFGFQSSSENPSGDRLFQLTFHDGGNTGSDGNLSDSVTQTVHVTAVNDAPVALNGTLTILEDSGANSGQAVVGPALGRLLGIPGLKLDTRLTSLLAFIYTYHYLNWFIKADVIRWADVPRARLALVIGASAASTALYFYDFAFGFTVLLALSLVHIVLEFPLNSLAIRQLGQAVGQGVRRSAQQRA